jgi:hypothetical protein
LHQLAHAEVSSGKDSEDAKSGFLGKGFEQGKGVRRGLLGKGVKDANPGFFAGKSQWLNGVRHGDAPSIRISGCNHTSESARVKPQISFLLADASKLTPLATENARKPFTG